MRQSGSGADQVLFRDILLRLRNAETTVDDWKCLMTRTLVEVGDVRDFDNALHLCPTTEAVAKYNVSKLRANGQPVAVIKAVHTGPGASKTPSDDAGGLEPVVCLAHGARVMISANLWVEVGLVNGGLGTIVAIAYGNNQRPPDLPVAVMVRFDSYSGPTLPDGSVPITPLRPFPFQRLANLSKSRRLQDRLKEDARLMQLSARTLSGGKIPRVSGSSSHEEHMVNGITTDSIPFQEQPNADYVTAENVPSLPTPQQLTVEEMDQSSAEIPTGSPHIPPESMDQEPAMPHGAPNLPLLYDDSESDVQIIPSSQQYVCPFKYHPVDYLWQKKNL